MVVVGVDAHKRSHTMVAVDGRGRKLAEKTVPATSAGHTQALRWALSVFDGETTTWGVEDVRSVTARLERDLMDAGAVVVRVPASVVAQVRGSAREVGKSDPIDALAVARAVLQDPNLPRARHDPDSLACKLMVDRRDTLVQRRSATMTRLQWRIHQLDPKRDVSQGKLGTTKHRNELRRWLTKQDGLLAELARDEVDEISQTSEFIQHLERRISAHIEQIAPSLLSLFGCGPLMAAKIVGEAADVTRFRSESTFARFAGVGPLPMWSGSTAGLMRTNKSGNRQVIMALHRIAVTQIRSGGTGADYYRKRIDGGDRPAMARRCLKRHVARAVYRALLADTRRRASPA